jgi:DNA polymerase eta
LVGNQSKLNVTNVHLAFTGIEFAETGQQTIERFLKPPSPPQKRLYGGESPNTLEDEEGADEGRVEDKTAYRCPRCGKTFRLDDVEIPSLEEQNGDILGYMNKVKLEHEDYHFAQDLANESEVQNGKATTSNNSNHKKRKKAQSKLGGIEKFFKS